MVSQLSINSMIGLVVFSVLLFVGAIIYTKRKVGVSWKPLIFGLIGFIIFTQILEKLLHLAVVTMFPNYAEHPWLFGIYGGLAAGIFEEVGRFLLFIWLLKKYQRFQDGISFGVGWGGIEAVVIALSTTLPMIIFASMMNAGTFDSELAASLPGEQVELIKDQLLNQSAFSYLWGIPERFFALLMQIALTLVVLLAVVKNKFKYVVYAIVVHAMIDFPLVFFQTGHLKSLWIIELYIAVIGILSIIFIKRVRKHFVQ